MRLTGAAISVTGTCTLACSMCYAHSSPLVTDVYTLDEITGMLDVLRREGIRHVFLGGGEPLLHPDLGPAIAHARSLDYSVSVSTNGHLITQSRLAELFSAGLTHDLSVSLDGPDETTNSVLRGRGAFAPTLRGMYELQEFKKILWGVNFVSARPNRGRALATAELARRMGASYFNLIRFSPSGRGRTTAKHLAIAAHDFAEERASISSVFDELDGFYDDIYLYDLSSGSTSMTSYFDVSMGDHPLGISIDSSGNVELTPPSILLGNVRSETLDTALGRISSESTLQQLRMWWLGEHEGVHQPKRGS